MGSTKTFFNQSYISPEMVWADLVAKYKTRRIDLSLIVDWCSKVEREFISDVTTMIHYQQQPLTVKNRSAYLPNNLYRLLNVYTDKDNEIRYSTNGSYLFDLYDYNGNAIEDDEVIYVDYIGLVLDDECRPMIHEAHRQACETFCKMQMFEEDYAMGKFNANLWREWYTGLPGMIQAARGSNYRQFSKAHLKNINVIRGNMFPRLENNTLRDENIYPQRQD